MQRRLLILLFLLFPFIQFNSYAQEREEEEIIPSSLNNESNRKHSLKVNVLGALNRMASLSYENALSTNKSLQIGITYGKSRFMGDALRMSVTPEFRFYLSGLENGLVGFYTAPYAKFQVINDKETTDDGNVHTDTKYQALGGGLTIGRQWIAKKGFTVDIFGGAGYNPIVKVVNSQSTHPTSSPSSENAWRLDVRLGLSMGLAF